MTVGALIPNSGPVPARVGIAKMAAAAERAGARSLWVSDHLLLVDAETSDYPYSDDGAPTWDVEIDYYEALITCTHIAAATETARVGTAVMVLPQRNVLEVAKMAATLDRLSGGRLALGVGAGWNHQEFEALGHKFETRGRRFDEMLEVLRDCWTGRPGEFRGAEVTVPPGVVLMPTPPRVSGGPPLLVGGVSPRARRRAAEHGDGWLAIAFADRWDPDDLQARLEDTLRRRAECDLERQFESLLLLHSSPEEADRVPGKVSEALAMGFNEVVIELPWLDGVEPACHLLAAAISTGAGR